MNSYKYSFIINAKDEEKAEEIISGWDREMIMDNINCEVVKK